MPKSEIGTVASGPAEAQTTSRSTPARTAPNLTLRSNSTSSCTLQSDEIVIQKCPVLPVHDACPEHSHKKHFDSLIQVWLQINISPHLHTAKGPRSYHTVLLDDHDKVSRCYNMQQLKAQGFKLALNDGSVLQMSNQTNPEYVWIHPPLQFFSMHRIKAHIRATCSVSQPVPCCQVKPLTRPETLVCGTEPTVLWLLWPPNKGTSLEGCRRLQMNDKPATKASSSSLTRCKQTQCLHCVCVHVITFSESSRKNHTLHSLDILVQYLDGFSNAVAFT